MNLRNRRADFGMGVVSARKILLIGGAESEGQSEEVDWENRTSLPLFSYDSCLKTASTTHEVEFADLRWCCCCFK